MTSAPLRRTADQALFVVLGASVKVVFNLLSAVVLARLLDQADFGTYRQCLLLFGTVLGVTSLGLPQALLYLVPSRLDKDAPSCIALAHAICLGTTVVGAALLWALGPWLARAFSNPDLPPLLRLGSVYLLCESVTQCLPFLLIGLGRHSWSAYISGSLAFVQTTALLVAAALGAGLQTLVAILSGVSLLGVFISLVLIQRLTRSLPNAPGSGLTSTILRYSLPLGLNSMIGTFNWKVDRFLISIFFNPTVLAVYSVGAIELPIVPTLPHAIGRALIPRFVELDRSGRRTELLALWHRSIIKVGLLIFPVFCICFGAADFLIAALYGQDYAAAAGIFRIYLLLLPLRLTSYGAVLQALGDSRSLLRGTVYGTVFGTGLGIGLVQAAGWYGPAIAAVGTAIAVMLYLLGAIRRALGTTWGDVWPWCPLLKLSSAAACAGLLSAGLGSFAPGGLLSTSAGIAAFLVVFAGLAFVLGLVDRDDWFLARRWLTMKAFR